MNHGFPSGAGETLWPFFLYNGLVLLVVAGIILASYLLGERHRARGRNLPYESGITPTGSARLRYGAHFYPVGIFFILFDVEAIFLYAWAVAFRELSWAGYIEALLFIIVLLLGLVYVWKLGGLDWSPSRRRTTSLVIRQSDSKNLQKRWGRASVKPAGGVHETPPPLENRQPQNADSKSKASAENKSND